MTTKCSAGATRVAPRPRSSFSSVLAAWSSLVMSFGWSMRVSKAAAFRLRRQLDGVEPLVQADGGVGDLGAVLLDRVLAGGLLRHAEGVRRPADDEQPDVGARPRSGRPATETASGRRRADRPSAIACAIVAASPNTDS